MNPWTWNVSCWCVLNMCGKLKIVVCAPAMVISYLITFDWVKPVSCQLFQGLPSPSHVTAEWQLFPSSWPLPGRWHLYINVIYLDFSAGKWRSRITSNKVSVFSGCSPGSQSLADCCGWETVAPIWGQSVLLLWCLGNSFPWISSVHTDVQKRTFQSSKHVALLFLPSLLIRNITAGATTVYIQNLGIVTFWSTVLRILDSSPSLKYSQWNVYFLVQRIHTENKIVKIKLANWESIHC